MAIYRLEVKAISRGQGRSCVAAAAYRHGCLLNDERQQITHDYSRKQAVEYSEIIAPENAPSWVLNREQLWNRADAAEKRKDALTAREILLTLPRELTAEQNVELVRNFCRQFTARGIVADIAIHAPDTLPDHETGQVHEQRHAHVMLTDRALDGDGFAGRKDRTLAGPEGVEAVRASWADHANGALERAGLGERLDHRSLERQRTAAVQRGDEIEAARLDRPPEPKIGPMAAAMIRSGRADAAHAWRDVREVRRERNLRDGLAEAWRFVRAKAVDLGAEIGDKARQLVEAAKVFLDLPEVAAAGQALQWREAEKILLQRQQAQQKGLKLAFSRDLGGLKL